jgi:hypothetical protein
MPDERLSADQCRERFSSESTFFSAKEILEYAKRLLGGNPSPVAW